MSGTAANFQVKLAGEWKDYVAAEDRILKQAYLCGHPKAGYKLRGSQYEVDFQSMSQVNKTSGKKRDIRPPFKWKQPEKPLVQSGPSFVVRVAPGTPGTVMRVPHPKDRTQFISIEVPASAKVGQSMVVPLPDLSEVYATPAPAAPMPEPSAPMPEAPAPPEAAAAEKGSGWSTGAKVATGAAAVAGGGVVVAGAVLGAHIADVGWDAAMDDVADVGDAVGDGVVDAGEAVGAAAEDAVDWAGDAGEAAGDFIMDLF